MQKLKLIKAILKPLLTSLLYVADCTSFYVSGLIKKEKHVKSSFAKTHKCHYQKSTFACDLLGV